MGKEAERKQGTGQEARKPQGTSNMGQAELLTKPQSPQTLNHNPQNPKPRGTPKVSLLQIAQGFRVLGFRTCGLGSLGFMEFRV